jgi:ketosteroid isomerase-like protein
MPTSSKTLIDLEKKFWQSMVDEDSDAAVKMLSEPALMVSSHGSIKFDHAGYRKMAEQGTMVIKAFEMSDVEVTFPNDATAIVTYQVKQEIAPRGKGETMVQEMNDTSTWIQAGRSWKCVMHTETPAESKDPAH